MIESTVTKPIDSLGMFYYIEGEVRIPDMVALVSKHKHQDLDLQLTS